MTPAKITVIVSASPSTLTKSWRIQGGQPRKTGAGSMTKGDAIVVEVPTPEDLATVLQQLEKNHALVFGLPPADHCQIVTEEKLPDAPAGTIARNNDYFTWSDGPAVMMDDYDPRPGETPLSHDELLAQIYAAAPALKDAPTVWSTSSSSCIVNTKTGEEVTGIRGQRLYFLVSNGTDIPRAGKVLVDRLWLNGHGYLLVSKSGQMLERCTLDGSVWQPCRLDFAAAPVCLPPLECRRPAPLVINPDAPPINLAEAIPDLSKAEKDRLAQIKRAARADAGLVAEQKRAQSEWIDARQPADEAARARLKDAVENRRLCRDFTLICQDGQQITVGDLLDNPAEWHGKRFHDPLEPDYSNSDCRIAYASLQGSDPCVYSHAHGGSRYTLHDTAEASVDLSKFVLNGTAAELRRNMLAMVYILPDMAILGQATAIYADPNAGKTLALIWMLCLNFEDGVLNPSDIYYINADDTEEGLITKLEIAEEHGFPMMVPGRNGFRAEYLTDILSRLVSAGEAKGKVFILDTLKKFTDLMDKSNSSAFGEACRQFVNHGGSIVALAHTNKHADAHGKKIHAGTADIVQDFDAAYVAQTHDDAAGTRTVTFTAQKVRGPNAQKISFQYDASGGLTYRERLATVERLTDTQQRENEAKERLARLSAKNREACNAIRDALHAGVSLKTELVKTAAGATGLTRKAILRALEDHTGKDLTQCQFWTHAKGEKNATFYKLNLFGG